SPGWPRRARAPPRRRPPPGERGSVRTRTSKVDPSILHRAMKTALITGASRGLGREAAKQLEERGWRVIRTSRPGLDVADPKSIAAAAAELHHETIDCLVNNAGVALDGFDAEVARKTI